ncbi:MAG: chromosome segregation protein SMC [Actinomycetota bacterium]|nr:MAG: chromosome segregation protein SMC [Actinomycetota bacterium]
MHLKSLTLKGFKSFAAATTLSFEPGVTCVVGPNGSGKSNVVDALAWVMGEQGAKSLRGGKMEDVIFAGTAGRAPLGRAEVSLTIDNTDGALPIEYAEVTITRTMFRNGGSDYQINGAPARLLDVQELLSDSGIGREMHVIVGQGQLDTVLHASPEDRRGFIEEAAGVLKHRKRKERALRKLEAMDANLTRLQDLTGELRRQLKPLGRQAEVARRASAIQADLRDARLRLLADDVVSLQGSLAQEIADETALRERRGRVEGELASASSREAAAEAALAALVPQVSAAQDTWFRLSSLAERFRGTQSVATERVRHVGTDRVEERPGPPPEELEAQARSLRAEEFELGRQVEGDRDALAAASTARTAAEEALATAERDLVTAVRAAADRREGLARLAGQVAAARSRAEARAAEVDRLTAGADDARARADAAAGDFQALETRVAGLDEGELGLDHEHEDALAALAAADADVERLRGQEAVAERERAAAAARVEALELGLVRGDGGAAVLAAGSRLAGILGAVAGLITVEPGYETALAAALGPLADAVAVADDASASAALDMLREDDGGRVALLLADAPASTGQGRPASSADLAPGGRPLADLVTVADAVRPALAARLAAVVVVDDIPAALTLHRREPDLVVVTRAGDVVAGAVVTGGSASAPSLLEVQAAVDEAAQQLVAVGHEVERTRFELAAATDRRTAATARVEASLARLHESDARMAAVADQLGQLGSAARAAAAEAERLTTAREAAASARLADERTVAELAARLDAASTAGPVTEPSPDERDRLAVAASAARQREVEARLAVRTGEERVRALTGRAEQLEHAAAQERAARRAAEQRRLRRQREATVAAAVLRGVRVGIAHLDASLALATVERDRTAAERTALEQELHGLRARVRELTTELEALTDSVHRDEVARAEQRLRIEALQTRAIEELGVAADVLVAEYGPDQLVPPPAVAPGDEPPADAAEPTGTPYVRAEQEKRLRAAERALTSLGKVNPLALEEYASLEERLAFLTEQLDDLKRSRADLLGIVRDVDQRVQQVFAEAFRDTAAAFEGVFARLFPGGEGRLVLTEPDDLLTTGVEVEARPPGKKVKRLSLLSGGERSLTAVAFLVALFKARPSPFYVLDEVEAALDDVNLGRLIEVIDELRSTSQLLVVTHQKRTMEIADALYGVSMRGDGVTQVISQRLREREAV